MREFAKPDYAVDLLKLESPLAAASLPARDGSAGHHEAQARFDAVGEICREAGLPWVLLSGGASTENFERVLQYAYAAGAGGFLAGRTIWLEAVRSHFPDTEGVARALKDEGVQVLDRLNRLTKAEGTRWTPRFEGLDAVKAEGDFSRQFGMKVAS